MGKIGRITVILVILLGSLFVSQAIFAMSSPNYLINWDSINIGGTDFSSSTNFWMHDTMGEMSTGLGSSANYWLSAGYRLPWRGDYIHFTVSGQDNASQVSYTGFDNVNKQVVVSSAGGYGVGNYIAVVEDLGQGQKVAIGKITNIAGNTITVDKWDGDNAAMSPAPVGGNDYVYKLTTNRAALAMLSVYTVKTAVSRTEVDTNAPNGYMVSVVADGELRNGPEYIDPVTDGTVTPGVEEYGIQTVGATASGTNDFALNTTGQSIQESTSPGRNERVGIIYKAAIDSSTSGGAYMQTVAFYITPNF